MRRFLNLFLIAAMVMGAGYTFEMKRRAENAAGDARRLARTIELEKDEIELIKTDISVLTQPSRLQTLTKQHENQLELKPLRVDQIITLDELPQRPIDLSPLERDSQLGGYVDGSESKIQ